MRKFMFLLLGTAMLIGIGMNAQNNACTFEYDDGNFKTVTVSDNYQIKKINDHSSVRYKEIKNQPSKTRANHALTIHVKGEWGIGAIGDGGDYFDFLLSSGEMEQTMELTVPEGVYYIMFEGFSYDEAADEYKVSYLNLDQIEVNKSTTLEADFSTCTNKVVVNAVDQNGKPVPELEFANLDMDSEVLMNSIGMSFNFGFMCFDEGWANLAYYFNDISASNSFTASLKFLTREGDDYYAGENYYIAFTEDNGITESKVLSNTPEDLVNHKQFFNIKEDPFDSYSFLGILNVYYDDERDGWSYSSGFNAMCLHDREKPYSLYTNVKYNENPQNGESSVFLLPQIYETVDLYAFNQDYSALVASAPIGINSEGRVFKDCFGKFNYFNINETENQIRLLPKNPLAKFYESGEIISNGFRTPHLYYMPFCYNSSNSPTGTTILSGSCLYLGENNEQREGDLDVLINVKVNDGEIFNDSLYKFNMTAFEGNPGIVNMTLTNDKIVAYGRTMFNNTQIELDLAREDAMPPSLTVLRVVNENDEIVVHVTNPKESKLEIAAGDYAYDETTWNMKYVGKPGIEVRCIVGDSDSFLSLEAVEDPSRFHTAYGNVFEVSLAPLDEIEMTEEWILVEVTLSDGTGNKITQILDPLFLCSTGVGIPTLEQSAKHTVFPNPFTGEITISLEKPLQGEIYFEVYDMLGRVIHQQRINCDQTTTFHWDGSRVKSGVYFYGIYNDGAAVKGKMVKP